MCIYVEPCLQSDPDVCNEGKTCHLIKDMCSEEVDETTDCPGVCDVSMTFSVDDIDFNEINPKIACKEPCSSLAERTDLPSRKADCNAGCDAGVEVVSRDACASACGGLEVTWETDCISSCQRRFDMEKRANPSTLDCGQGYLNCTACTVSGCSWCQIHQGSQVIFADCIHSDDMDTADCVELGGLSIHETDSCPSEADPCSAERPCPEPSCNSDDELIIHPLEQGQCCPQTQCIPSGIQMLLGI